MPFLRLFAMGTVPVKVGRWREEMPSLLSDTIWIKRPGGVSCGLDSSAWTCKWELFHISCSLVEFLFHRVDRSHFCARHLYEYTGFH